MPDPTLILYVGAVLPKRSETFVYREVFALRALGHTVVTASVRPAPAQEFEDDEALRTLADQTTVVYDKVMPGDAIMGAVRRPRVLLRGLLDALLGRDLRPMQRPKLLVQCLGGLALAYRMRAVGVEHVHAHMAHVPASVAMYAASALRVPFSFTGHAADLFRDRQFLRAKLRRAAFVACISHWHRRFYQQVLPRPDERWPVIRCGVDVEAFQVRPRPGLGRVLAVGRLVEKKGFDVLLRAMVAHQGVSVTLVGDGPAYESLKALADELGVWPRVRFTGAMSNEKVRQLMHESDLFVLPCKPASDGDRDGIPVVLMEAMACGLPVISGDLEAIRELVEPGVTGLMVRPGDADDLSAALDRLLSDPALAQTLSMAGRQRVVEEFSQTVNIQRLRRAIEARPQTLAQGQGALT